ncbi:SLBB domain-containing protein [Adlercreutzia sp. ZJ154]|uniref:SLBB domain-containing protein n=1 Tax=Adlercreutzia sp. ZJ154 TaxID=2709790 RepID=UPI0013EC9698|nr:SLBB domain-containing protein [Adlercreutzia sp. ZJ154]
MGFQDYSESAKSKLHLGQIRPQIVIGIAAICVVALGALLFGLKSVADTSNFQIVEAQAAETTEDAGVQVEDAKEASIFVHVTGCVLNAGLYELTDGARIADAISAAGGFSDNACTDALNLAQVSLMENKSQYPAKKTWRKFLLLQQPLKTLCLHLAKHRTVCSLQR